VSDTADLSNADRWLRAVIVLAMAGAAASLGPWLAAPGDAPARESFAYTPPPGFVAAEATPEDPLAMAEAGARLWVDPTWAHGGYSPNVSLRVIPDRSSFGTSDLDSIAANMGPAFVASGTSWKLVRRSVVKREDGARVGVLVGQVTRGQRSGYESMQLAFPTDEGSRLVTASFGTADAAHFEPLFEATVHTARGVARRASPPPLWSYPAWGLGGGVLALLLLGRPRKKGDLRAPAESSTTARSS